MPIDFKDDKSRSALRAKRRKTNIVLNTLIAVVIILILLVGGSIFFGGNDSNKEQAESPKNTEDVKQNDQTSADNDVKQEENAIEDEPTVEEEEGGKVEEMESDEPNVEKVLINPDWKPVGTEQANGHQSSYTMGTTDWNEKLQAAAYAIDTSVDNMTAWWVTGGDDPENQAELTVSAKGSDDTYRVYIEWITGEGWKPVEVKKLIQNDKR
ncbi:YrrS [Bacillus freudenreichii]|nr:YrrS [Bacillus freudenreichii]